MSVNRQALYYFIRAQMEVCQNIMKMRCYDILFRHYHVPGGFHFLFIIFRALIFYIFYSLSVFQGIDKADFET